MSLRAFGVNIYISVPFAVMLAFLLFMDTTGLMSASLLAVLLHEVGHLAAMKLTHCEPRAVNCSLSGVTIVSKAYTSAKESIIIALSGPLLNIVLSVLLWILGKVADEYLILAFSVVQFLVGGVNLLPVKGLDGGDILRILLSKTKICNVGFVCTLVSIVTACVMLVVGLAVVVKNVSNPSLLLLGIYLIIENIMIFGRQNND